MSQAVADLSPGGPTARAWRARPGWLVCGALLFCGLVYFGPMLSLASWAFKDPNAGWNIEQLRKVATDDAYHLAFYTTFKIAFITTAICVVLGYPYAYLMATSAPRATLLLAAAVMIPFWTSILARSLAWIILLGRKGILNEWLSGLGWIDRPISLLFNAVGVQIGMVHVLLPFMVLPIWAVISRLDPGLPRAARSLGASPFKAFLLITFPLSLPGLAAGATLVFMFAIGFYITPALLGGPNELTIATLIEMVVRDLLDWPFGAMLSLTLIALIGLIFSIGAIFAGAGRIAGMDRS